MFLSDLKMNFDIIAFSSTIKYLAKLVLPKKFIVKFALNIKDIIS